LALREKFRPFEEESNILKEEIKALEEQIVILNKENVSLKAIFK